MDDDKDERVMWFVSVGVSNKIPLQFSAGSFQCYYLISSKKNVPNWIRKLPLPFEQRAVPQVALHCSIHAAHSVSLIYWP